MTDQAGGKLAMRTGLTISGAGHAAVLLWCVVTFIARPYQTEPLKGLPAEERTLRITARDPGTVDLTIAFRARNEIPDLGGRDRIHFLVRCQ